MRWLIDYIRSCFCNHDWELLTHVNVRENYLGHVIGEKLTYRCKKCGYAKTYKNY